MKEFKKYKEYEERRRFAIVLVLDALSVSFHQSLLTFHLSLLTPSVRLR